MNATFRIALFGLALCAVIVWSSFVPARILLAEQPAATNVNKLTAAPDSYSIRYARQGTTWIETPEGTAQFKMLVDRTNLPPAKPHGRGTVEIAAYTQQAGSISTTHQHESDEIFYITSGELINILNPGTAHERFVVAKPGMVSVVAADQQVIHWVPSESEPVRGLVIWAPGHEEERLEEHFLSGQWLAPFQVQEGKGSEGKLGVARVIKTADLPKKLRDELEQARKDNAK